MSASLRPFQRLPFAQLADAPARPHPYFSSVARELDMASSDFGRLKIHWREHGSGPPLLLVHGLMTSSYSWRYVLDALGARFRLIVPDLPGAGRSDKPRARLDAAALARWIGEFQSALGVRGCAAVGNSLGGYLCMRLALADPGALSRLVNIHSPAFPIARLRALAIALAVPGARRLLAWWVARSPERWVHRNVHYYDETLKSLEEARVYAEPLSSPDGVRAFIAYLADTMAPRGFAEFAAALAREKAERRRFPIPLRLIYSREDPLVPPETGARLAALVDGAELHWLERTSHFAHVDSPERVAPLLVDFLA
ncbi:MAG TPA: alpha/beta hydrolase [Polyangia bacterium]|nr:alpha/beta hydrolase [Polyangia bacterium]